MKKQKTKLQSRKYPGAKPWSIGRSVALVGLMCLVCFGVVLANKVSKSDDDLGSTREALKEWVTYSRKIAKEEREFEVAKAMLKERIELVQNEIESLWEKTQKAKKEISEKDKQSAEKVEENKRLKEVISSLTDTATRLEKRTVKLLKRLPDPVRRKVKPLSQQIPEKPDETKLSVSQRFMNIAGILNEVNKFNRQITVTSEVRELPEGKSVEVTTLYVGIGQAYYTSGAEGDQVVAGVGRSSESGWTWAPAKDPQKAARQISKAIAIYENEEVASFVQLPIEIND